MGHVSWPSCISVMQHKLPTSCLSPSICPLGHQHGEDPIHLFFSCSYTVCCWEFSIFNLSWVFGVDFRRNLSFTLVKYSKVISGGNMVWKEPKGVYGKSLEWLGLFWSCSQKCLLVVLLFQAFWKLQHPRALLKLEHFCLSSLFDLVMSLSFCSLWFSGSLCIML